MWKSLSEIFPELQPEPAKPVPPKRWYLVSPEGDLVARMPEAIAKKITWAFRAEGRWLINGSFEFTGTPSWTGIQGFDVSIATGSVLRDHP